MLTPLSAWLINAVASVFQAVMRIDVLSPTRRAGAWAVKIERIETKIFRIPLATPVEAAGHGVMSEFDMVAVRLTDSAGGTGCGYTVLNAGHGDAVVPIIDNVFSKTLLAEDSRCIERMWARMWRSHHYSGRGGLVSFAIAAVDVALWDLRGRNLGGAALALAWRAQPGRARLCR
jgi:L-alanine-DL-glutamate epimerase-like enolase superfamily enzyme